MVILLMGVSGSGKTTIGKILAQQQHWQFKDADDFHSQTNKDKMQGGEALTDADRRPWLELLREEIDRSLQTKTDLILACSALKATYRQVLADKSDRVKFVYLKGSFELIQQRLQERHGHFMNPDLLRSQFDDLEEPEGAIVIDITASPEDSVNQIQAKLNLLSQGRNPSQANISFS
jgi:gluconokinase